MYESAASMRIWPGWNFRKGQLAAAPRLDDDLSLPKTHGPAHILFLVGTTIDACAFRMRPQAAASPAADQLLCRLSRNPWPSLPSENNRAPARLRSSAAAGRYVSCRSR